MDQSTVCLCVERWPSHMILVGKKLELHFLGESNNAGVFVGFEMSVLLTTAIFVFFLLLTLDTSHSDDVWIYCGPSKETSWHIRDWEDVRAGDVHVV